MLGTLQACSCLGGEGGPWGKLEILRKSLESLVITVDSDCTSLSKASRVAQLGVDVVSEDDSNSLKKHMQTRFFQSKPIRVINIPVTH